jgi:hypothetical protein
LTIENFNQLGKKNDRRSFTGHYFVDPRTNRPRNPMGRTGRKTKNSRNLFFQNQLFSNWSWSSVLLGTKSCW